MTRERNIQHKTLLHAALVAGTTALLALNAGCAVNADPKISDTTICTDASREVNPDGSTTVHTEWRNNPYASPPTTMIFTYTDGHSEQVLDTTRATTEPQTFQLPKGTLNVMVTIVNADDTVAYCPSIATQ